MKRNMFRIIVILITLCVFSPISTKAEKSALLPASVVDSNGEKWGYIDEAGSFKVNPVYEYVSDFNTKGIAIVSEKGKYSFEMGTVLFIDRTGKKLLGPYNCYIPEFKDGIALVKRDGQTDLCIDESGKILFESKYELNRLSEGLISFSQITAKGKTVYGYLDLSGKVVIAAAYNYAGDFQNGRAAVTASDGGYLVIDKKGKVLESVKRYYDYSMSEGMISFFDEKSGTYGYKLQEGKIAIIPKFNTAGEFHDGCAVVGIDTEVWNTKYGLIDKNGNYILKPEYSGIDYLGNNLFAVSQNFNYPNSHNYSPKAIFNNKGERLTDYKYNNVEKYNGDYASACDELTTFFIDAKGNIVEKLPRLKGIGKLSFMGDIIKAEVDRGLTYINSSGNVIWDKDETIYLNNGVTVKKVRNRLDYLTYIEYPEFRDMENEKIQADVNSQLKKLFTAGFEAAEDKKQEPGEEEFYEDIYIGYSVQYNKDLLIVSKSGYYYTLGAAHGQPSMDYYFIDMKTGVFYKLKDLFKSSSKYKEKLFEIVNRQLKLNTKIADITGDIGYLDDKAVIDENQYFIIEKDCLKIYFYPYEIAPYAAGFPEFEIPYGQITDILDTKGAFWNSFDKTVINHKTKVFSDIEESVVNSVTKLMDSYEKKIIEAINTNSFAKVENCLLNGSSLYNSQKKLVQNLYKQRISEKLNKYEVYALDYDYVKKEYRVFILEEIAVKYPGKSYVKKQYSWYYTIKVDSTNTYKLSGITKW